MISSSGLVLLVLKWGRCELANEWRVLRRGEVRLDVLAISIANAEWVPLAFIV